MAYTSRTVVNSGETKNLSTDFGGETTFEIPTKGTYGGAFQINEGGTVNSGSSAVTFQNNSAVEGGAIFNKGTITFQNDVSFNTNKATSQYGGAIFNFTNATITAANNTTISFTGNSINANSYSVMGGAINNGGTIDFSGSTVNFTNNTLVNTRSGNETFAWGGAVANSGTITFSDVTFSGNSAANGGAIYNSGTTNLKGLMTLSDTNQTILNSGTFNWDLTGGTASYGSLAGYALFNNNSSGKATITVSDNVHAGDSFTIATSDSGFSGCNQTFTLTGMEGTATITIGGAAVEYNNISYTLYTDDTNLILQAGKYVKYELSDSIITTYDGEAKTVSVTVTEPTAGVTAYYSIDGGTTWNAGTSCSVTDAGSTDVKFKLCAEGYLDTITDARSITIGKRSVKLESDTLTAMYDGMGLEGSVTVSGEGFVKDEATATASTLNKVGSITNEITINKGEAYKDSNYDIETTTGTLTCTAPDKDMYDSMIVNPEFTYDGTLPVIPSTGNALRSADIDVLMASTGIDSVAFEQDLIDINKLTFNALEVAKTISFLDGYGTTGSDTIRFAKNTAVTIGKAGRVIDLEEGNNKVQVDKGAYATINSDLVNVSNVKVASDAGESSFAGITFADGRSASLEIGSNTAVSAGIVTGSDKKTTVSIGKDSAFVAKAITFEANNGALSIGSRSGAKIDSIDAVSKVTLSSGKYDKKAEETLWTKLEVAGNVTGTEKSDTFEFGSYSDVDLAGFYSGDGTDKMIIGSYADVDISNIDFGDGNDTLKLGSDATVDITGLLDFGDGSDKLSIGKNATLTVDRFDVDSLEEKGLSMSNGAKLCIANADDLASAQSKWAKYAERGQIVSA